MIPMLTLNGNVLNVFDQPASTDKATGEVRPAKCRVQIMAENELQNGEKRLELVNLTIQDPDLYRSLEGRSVSVPVGAFVASGSVLFYALKGQKPIERPAVAGGAGAGARSAHAPAPRAAG